MGKRVNTTIKERKALLKELGYTEEEMQKFYDEAAEVNRVIKALKANGTKWTDLCVYQMRQLPGLKERTLETLKRKEEEAKEKEAKEAEERNKEAYYKEHFEEICLEKIEKNENLTEQELSELVFTYAIEHSYDADNTGRWTIPCKSIIKLCGKTFAIDWDKGLTEYQENEFFNQPYAVKKRTRTITIEELV